MELKRSIYHNELETRKGFMTMEFEHTLHASYTDLPGTSAGIIADTDWAIQKAGVILIHAHALSTLHIQIVVDGDRRFNRAQQKERRS